MKKLTKKQVDGRICWIIGRINEYKKEGKEFKQQHAVYYCCQLELPFMTFYGRVLRNQAFGLQYNKITKVYTVNTDKPKTLESIAEKHVEPSTRPKTLTDYEQLKKRVDWLYKREKQLKEWHSKNMKIYENNLQEANQLFDQVDALEQRLTNNVDRTQDDLSELKVKTSELRGLVYYSTFFQRLRWLFAGRVS